MPEEPPNSSNLANQLAEVAIKVLKPGGVGFGSLLGLWFLLVESKVAEAIAATLIGFCLSYAGKLWEPIHQGNQRRLEETGKTINQTIDRTTERVVTRATGFEDWYLQCQAWDCQSYRPEGVAQYEGIFSPLLEEVFVPLALDLSGTLPGFKPTAQELTAQDCEQLAESNVWHFLGRAEQTRPFRQLVILAWGGYGKTTLLKHIAYIYGTQQHHRHQVRKRLPVLLVLRKYRDLLAQENPPDLPALITQYHIPSLPKEGRDMLVPPNWATDLLRRGDAVIMLDGFDEVAKAQRPKVANWINTQMRRYGNSIFIVTSRPKAYREQDAAHRLELSTPLWVRDFDQTQRQDFITRWYQCQERYAHGNRNTPDVVKLANESAQDLLRQIEARQELKDLAKNPLLLNMIVTFHRRYPGVRLPQRRVELYREICLLQLRDRPRARQLDTLLTQCEAQIVLQQLALAMMQQRQERIPRLDLLPLLKHYLDQQEEPIAPKDFLDQVVQVSELLVEQEDEYEFAHLSFQEYLAATEIARTQQENVLYNHFNDDWWKPTILLYAAQVKPAPLIRQMLSQGATDLAYTCWQDATKQLDPTLETELKALRQAVTASRCQQLEQYLQNGQWREADEETYRLMITTVGKDEGQYFDKEDLLNFPCDDLKAIDGLWVKYSQGKFGFSVQKQIYVDCGAKLDGEYPGDKIWEEFCDRVGWRKDGKHLNYSALQANPSFSPRGEFPVVFGSLFSSLIRFSSLEQRLVNCSTSQF
ncbi:MAG: NACHT domain-containing protein [Leptolyngbyaceae cyanobacterium SM2_5_2]|nr:NACHT domain-containing protein [Leptolyngbyaceae cyanobacterium SM2_5_2]